ncbi:hypothetical protein Zmor_026016 [Zophobas morio]|uniref:Uncharacterized protein n=1 Tax=Zophobas morio TaxID=2755281 RepID=A0AA38HTC8_9CUCU|nr:hypothetical protein Zmor_026016 [Zophobas morio]
MAEVGDIRICMYGVAISDNLAMFLESIQVMDAGTSVSVRMGFLRWIYVRLYVRCSVAGARRNVCGSTGLCEVVNISRTQGGYYASFGSSCVHEANLKINTVLIWRRTNYTRFRERLLVLTGAQ